jgi:hypothetical protein
VSGEKSNETDKKKSKKDKKKDKKKKRTSSTNYESGKPITVAHTATAQPEAPQGPTPYLPLGSEEEEVVVVKVPKKEKAKSSKKDKHREKEKEKKHKSSSRRDLDAKIVPPVKRDSKRELRARGVDGTTATDTHAPDEFVYAPPDPPKSRKVTPNKHEKKQKQQQEKAEKHAKKNQESPGRSESAIFNSIGISAVVGTYAACFSSCFFLLSLLSFSLLGAMAHRACDRRRRKPSKRRTNRRRGSKGHWRSAWPSTTTSHWYEIM